MEPFDRRLAERLRDPAEHARLEALRRANEDAEAKATGCEPGWRYRERKLAERVRASAAHEPQRERARIAFDAELAAIKRDVYAGRITKAEARSRGDAALAKLTKALS